MPKAISLIAGSSLDSPALKFVGEAFDSVWRKVAGHFEGASEKEAARLILASAILAVTTNQTRDVGLLKHAGLRAMRQTFDLPSSRKNGEPT